MKQKTKKPELLFVFDTNSNWWNKGLWPLQRLLSPYIYICHLYMLVYGNFGIKSVWKKFLQENTVKIKFLHKDEFRKQITTLDIEYPIIFQRDKGKLRTFLTAKDINKLKNVDELIQKIEKTLPR